MVITALQTTGFFENADQMGLSNCTRVHLQPEGIITVDDLGNFEKEALWQ